MYHTCSACKVVAFVRGKLLAKNIIAWVRRQTTTHYISMKPTLVPQDIFCSSNFRYSFKQKQAQKRIVLNEHIICRICFTCNSGGREIARICRFCRTGCAAVIAVVCDYLLVNTFELYNRMYSSTYCL